MTYLVKNKFSRQWHGSISGGAGIEEQILLKWSSDSVDSSLKTILVSRTAFAAKCIGFAWYNFKVAVFTIFNNTSIEKYQ